MADGASVVTVSVMSQKSRGVLRWETLAIDAHEVRDAPKVLRARVLGGWLVWAHTAHGDGLTFLPDPVHRWDGGSDED